MTSISAVAIRLTSLALLLFAAGPAAQAPPAFEVHEATIAQIHAAMQAGRLTCRGLVEQYLRRIDTYDKNGPAINAIVVTNPDALKLADDLDRRFRGGRAGGPAALRAADREGQLRDRRPSKRERLAGAGRLRVGAGRFPGEARQGCRGHRDRQVEHGRMGVHAVRDGQLDPSGLYQEPVLP